MAEAPIKGDTSPLREYVKTYPIILEIYDGDTLIKSEKLDYGNFEDKKYLGRLSYWAWEKNYTVETRADK